MTGDPFSIFMILIESGCFMLAFLANTSRSQHLDMFINETISLAHRNCVDCNGSIAVEDIVCPIGIPNGDTLDVWPNAHKPVTKRWSIRHRFRIDIFSMVHCPTVGE